MAQVVEHLPSKCDTLMSRPKATTTKKKGTHKIAHFMHLQLVYESGTY
jgi:hypothetical protein